ncbi:uncharacterized protein LOC120331778 [Styela clava]
MFLKWILLLTGAIINGVFAKKYEIDLCKNQSQSLGYKGRNEKTDEWKLTANKCTTSNSVILFHFVQMNLRPYWICRGSLKISAYLSGAELCSYNHGLCFLVTSNNATAVDPTIIKRCRLATLIRSQELLPITVNFTKDRTDYARGFQLNYTFAMSSDIIERTSTVNEKQDDSGAVGAAIAFGIVCGLLSAILIAVAIRRFRKKAVVDAGVNNTMVTSPGNQYESTMQCDGEINPDTIYHTVDKPDEATEKETVVNQLYTMAP